MEAPRPRRRGFVVPAALTFIAVGAALALWPLIHQMNPNPGTARPEGIEIDVAALTAGQHLVANWQGRPVIIKRRTEREIELARAAPLDKMRDRFAGNPAHSRDAPATDANRSVPGSPQWLVVVGVNPRSGCRLRVLDKPDEDGTSFMCPCDASRFDTAGRVTHGPAQTNLVIPPVTLISPVRLRLG